MHSLGMVSSPPVSSRYCAARTRAPLSVGIYTVSAMTTTRRFFHGTTAVLQVGDRLVPGNEFGQTVYGAGPRAAHVYATSGVTDDEHTYAIAEAEEWGSDAADSFCDGSICGAVFTPEDFQPHHEAWRDGDLFACVRVYEIRPTDLSTVEPDDSNDVTQGGSRMAAARIVTRLR